MQGRRGIARLRSKIESIDTCSEVLGRFKAALSFSQRLQSFTMNVRTLHQVLTDNDTVSKARWP